jgi:hypothetical protein
MSSRCESIRKGILWPDARILIRVATLPRRPAMQTPLIVFSLAGFRKSVFLALIPA